MGAYRIRKKSYAKVYESVAPLDVSTTGGRSSISESELLRGSESLVTHPLVQPEPLRRRHGVAGFQTYEKSCILFCQCRHAPTRTSRLHVLRNPPGSPNHSLHPLSLYRLIHHQ